MLRVWKKLTPKQNMENQNMINRIRLETTPQRQPPQDRQVFVPPPVTREPMQQVKPSTPPPEETIADRHIRDADQFGATVEPPPAGNQPFLPGMLSALHGNIVNRKVVESESDDDYFHLACHVDGATKSKIERGEYIDLERLLPKKTYK